MSFNPEFFLNNSSAAENITVKCRKCRFLLFQHPEVTVQDAHGNIIKSGQMTGCKCNSEVWFIPEDQKPDWMNPNIEKGEWVKGKINCPKCNGRIGSYNFVSGMKCSCSSHLLTPIHIVKSKIDFQPVLS